MNTRSMTIEAYLDAFGSKEPVPGGGGATAVIGALACSACIMVCSLTMGKRKYADIEDEVRAIADRAAETRDAFLRLADEDAEAFEPLSQAYKNKDITDAQMDALLETAGSVPLRMMELAVKLTPNLVYLRKNGSKLAISDAVCGLSMAESVVTNGEVLTMCNVDLMKDTERIERMKSKISSLLAQYKSYLVE